MVFLYSTTNSSLVIIGTFNQNTDCLNGSLANMIRILRSNCYITLVVVKCDFFIVSYKCVRNNLSCTFYVTVTASVSNFKEKISILNVNTFIKECVI